MQVVSIQKKCIPKTRWCKRCARAQQVLGFLLSLLNKTESRRWYCLPLQTKCIHCMDEKKKKKRKTLSSKWFSDLNFRITLHGAPLIWIHLFKAQPKKLNPFRIVITKLKFLLCPRNCINLSSSRISNATCLVFIMMWFRSAFTLWNPGAWFSLN